MLHGSVEPADPKTISEGEFRDFVVLQKRGDVNMASTRDVSELTGLDLKVVVSIRKNYDMLMEKFPKAVQ